MKIFLLGDGPRLEHIREALGMGKLESITVKGDLAKVRFDTADLKAIEGDLLIVAEQDEVALRGILVNLASQDPQASVMVFTPFSSRPFAKEFPSFQFRDDRLIYKNELRELQRRAAGQTKVEAIREIVRKKPFLIVIWGNPDPDALGSACGLSELVMDDASGTTIAYTGEFTRPENSAMVDLLKIPTQKFTPDLITPDTIVATVDAQPSFFKLDTGITFNVIIDHHPLTDLGQPSFSDVRPTYGAASTILTEYYQTSGTRMSKRIATALFYGLKVDTGNLTRNVSDADIAAFRYLRVRVDDNLVRTIELSQLPRETLDFFAIAFANRKIIRDVAFAYLGKIDNADMCVHVADFFVKLTGISWVIVACRYKDRVVVVLRSDGHRKHAGRLAEGLFLEHGSAGGHRTMARAEMPLERLATVLRDTTDVAIEEWLLEKLGTRLKPLSKSIKT